MSAFLESSLNFSKPIGRPTVTISAGLQNMTDEDPPFVSGSFENGYAEALATIKGRFWDVQLKKRF